MSGRHRTQIDVAVFAPVISILISLFSVLEAVAVATHNLPRSHPRNFSQQAVHQKSSVLEVDMAPHAEVAGFTDTSSVIVNGSAQTKTPTRPVFTIDDVLPHRQKSKPPATTVAAFSDANMFKSKGCFSKPKAKSFAHRLTEESKSRKPSSLKGAMKYFRPGTISLCGGLPSRYVGLVLPLPCSSA